eukprot:55626_1
MAQLSTLSLLMQNTVIGVFIILLVLGMSAIIWNIAHVILFWRSIEYRTMGSPLTLKERKKITNLFSFNKHMKQYKKDRNIKSISKRFIYSIKTVRKYVDIWLQTNQHKTSWELHQRNIGRRRGYTTFHLFKLKEIELDFNTMKTFIRRNYHLARTEPLYVLLDILTMLLMRDSEI